MNGFDLSPLRISLETAGAATALTFLLGILAARAMAAYRGPGRGLLDGILTLPLVLPPTVAGFFLLLIFGRTSVIGRALEQIGLPIVFSWPGTVIAATVVAFPLMYRTALGGFEQVSPNLLGAARTLGAGEWRTFRHVLVPLARPGILAGTVLAFARALGEFGATLMLAGNIPGRTQTMPIAIFFAAEGGDMERALIWVALTAAMSLASVAALHRWGTPRRKGRPSAAPEPATIAIRSSPPMPARAELNVELHRRLPGFDLHARFCNRGRTLGLLGASGSGKSMTLAAIAGLATPQEGSIALNGRVLFDAKAGIRVPPEARKVGVVFQNDALFPHLTVRENIEFGLHSTSIAERERRVAEYARLAHVDALLDRYPDQLSGGQRQRVALARALAMEPDALLLDEPFTGLDPHLRRHLEEELRAVLAGYRGAVVLVTHDRSEAFRMCEEIVVLADGRVAGAGPRDELFANPQTLAAARVTGCKNLAPFRAAGPNRVRVDDWGCTLKLAGPIPPGVSHIGIRSHSVRLSAAPGGANTFSCQILDAVESPFEVTVYIGLECGRIEADLPTDQWQRLYGAGFSLPTEGRGSAGESACPTSAQPRLWVTLDPEKLLLLRDTMQHE